MKPILVVLSDGETTDGLQFDDVDDVVEGLRIPIYTVGFEADLDELGSGLFAGRGGEHRCERGRRRVQDRRALQCRRLSAMKPLAIWIGVVAVVFGGYAL